MRVSASSSGPSFSQLIGQSTAIVLLVLILGASVYLWRMRYLRSRAAMIAVALVVLALIYFAVKTPTVAA